MQHVLKNAFQERMGFILALILPALFFSPYLFTRSPQYLFLDDLYHLYFPQFIKSYYFVKAHIWVGLDFLTNNGASNYFLRPNIPTYYPVYYFFHKLWHLSSITQFARALTFLFYLHAVAAFYFCIRLCRDFFDLTDGYDIFLASAYTFAVAKWISIAPFFYIAAIFPLLLYTALLSLREPLSLRFILYSFPYVLAFLSGYLPLDVHAVLLVCLFVCFYFQIHYKPTQFSQYYLLLRTLPPLLLAVFVVFPLYRMTLYYHTFVSGIPDIISIIAHELSYSFRDLLAIVSRAFRAPSMSELPHVILGMIPCLAIILVFCLWNRLKTTAKLNALFAFSSLIFLIHLLLIASNGFGLADLFYYIVPALGKMHLYGRFFIVASFFAFLAAAIALKYLLEIKDTLPLQAIAAILFGLLFLLLFALPANAALLRPDVLVIDILLMTSIVCIAIYSRAPFCLSAIIAATFITHFGNFSTEFNFFTPSQPAPYRDSVVFSPDRQNSFEGYLKQFSTKPFIKYADITSSIEKINGVMLNYPWVTDPSHIRISNYMGYELHLSIDQKFLDRFPFFGVIDLPWLLRTGADFILYDAAAWKKYATLLKPYVDTHVPPLDLGYGFSVIKLKEKNNAFGVVGYSKTFDNGWVQLFDRDAPSQMEHFKTDAASFVRFEISNPSETVVRFSFFPSHMTTLLIDGQITNPVLKEGLLEFSLSPGKHSVQYLYMPKTQKWFVNVYRIYLILVALLAFGYTGAAIHRKYKGFKLSNPSGG